MSEDAPEKQPQAPGAPRGLSAAALKWFAIVTMLIDHTGAALLYGLAKARHGWGSGLCSQEFYSATRVIGRLAFPVFCFLLIEGLFHTRSRWKYLLRLTVFALISEIPFDLAFNSGWLDFAGGQNVFFTLALGLGACAAWDWLTKGNDPNCEPLRGVAAILAVAAACGGAVLLRTDYSGLGVALIFVMYILRDKPFARDLLAGGVLCLMFTLANSHWIEALAILSFPLLHLYNGQRGRQNKYFFYIFYPAHLMILAGILLVVQ